MSTSHCKKQEKRPCFHSRKQSLVSSDESFRGSCGSTHTSSYSSYKIPYPSSHTQLKAIEILEPASDRPAPCVQISAAAWAVEFVVPYPHPAIFAIPHHHIFLLYNFPWDVIGPGGTHFVPHLDYISIHRPMQGVLWISRRKFFCLLDNDAHRCTWRG